MTAPSPGAVYPELFSHRGSLREDFTIDTLPARIRQVGDLWAPLREAEPPDLLAAVAKLSRR